MLFVVVLEENSLFQTNPKIFLIVFSRIILGWDVAVYFTSKHRWGYLHKESVLSKNWSYSLVLFFESIIIISCVSFPTSIHLVRHARISAIIFEQLVYQYFPFPHHYSHCILHFISLYADLVFYLFLFSRSSSSFFLYFGRFSQNLQCFHEKHRYYYYYCSILPWFHIF